MLKQNWIWHGHLQKSQLCANTCSPVVCPSQNHLFGLPPYLYQWTNVNNIWLQTAAVETGTFWHCNGHLFSAIRCVALGRGWTKNTAFSNSNPLRPCIGDTQHLLWRCFLAVATLGDVSTSMYLCAYAMQCSHVTLPAQAWVLDGLICPLVNVVLGGSLLSFLFVDLVGSGPLPPSPCGYIYFVNSVHPKFPRPQLVSLRATSKDLPQEIDKGILVFWIGLRRGEILARLPASWRGKSQWGT